MRNKNIILILVILSTLIGCGVKKQESKPIDLDKEYNTFDNLFTSTDSAQYHIFAYMNYNNFNGKVKITTIPKRLYKYIDPGYDSLQNEFDEYSAVYKFDYNKNIIGYIYTFTSQYSPFAVGVVLYDKKTQLIVGKNEAADSFGDEGWVFQKDGWLKDVNGDGYLDILNREIQWDFSDDSTLYNDPNKSIVKDSIFASTYDPVNKEFVKLPYVNYNVSELVLKKFNE